MDLESITVFFLQIVLELIILFLVRLILLICILVRVAFFNFIGMKGSRVVHIGEKTK